MDTGSWRCQAGDGTGWADHCPFPVAPAGSAGPGSGLTVVARIQAHLDVFWIGPDNAVMTQWWDGNALARGQRLLRSCQRIRALRAAMLTQVVHRLRTFASMM